MGIIIKGFCVHNLLQYIENTFLGQHRTIWHGLAQENTFLEAVGQVIERSNTFLLLLGNWATQLENLRIYLFNCFRAEIINSLSGGRKLVLILFKFSITSFYGNYKSNRKMHQFRCP